MTLETIAYLLTVAGIAIAGAPVVILARPVQFAHGQRPERPPRASVRSLVSRRGVGRLFGPPSPAREGVKKIGPHPFN